jgi:hypothetical protein
LGGKIFEQAIEIKAIAIASTILIDLALKQLLQLLSIPTLNKTNF